MKYLTNDGKILLRKQLNKAYGELKYIELNVKPNDYVWRMQRRYIDGLEFLLEVKETK